MMSVLLILLYVHIIVAWFLANQHLSLAVSFPIVTAVSCTYTSSVTWMYAYSLISPPPPGSRVCQLCLGDTTLQGNQGDDINPLMLICPTCTCVWLSVCNFMLTCLIQGWRNIILYFGAFLVSAVGLVMDSLSKCTVHC